MSNNAEREDFCDFAEREGYPLDTDVDGKFVFDETKSAWNAWHARAQASGVPDGWKLVPIEPTDEMLNQAIQKVEIEDSYYSGNKFEEVDAKEAWKAMLSAAPAYNGKKEG